MLQMFRSTVGRALAAGLVTAALVPAPVFAATATITADIEDASGRPYKLAVPDSPAPSSGFPVVIWLHGSGLAENSEAPFTPEGEGLQALAADRNLIAVVPYAGPGENPNSTNDDNRWRNYQFDAQGNYVGSPNDVTYILAVLEEVKARYPVNPNRIYIGGHSGGAAMSLTVVGAGNASRFAARFHLKGLFTTAQRVGQERYSVPPARLTPGYALPTLLMRGRCETQTNGNVPRNIQDADQKAYLRALAGVTGAEPPTTTTTVDGDLYTVSAYTGLVPFTFVETDAYQEQGCPPDPNNPGFDHAVEAADVRWVYDNFLVNQSATTTRRACNLSFPGLADCGRGSIPLPDATGYDYQQRVLVPFPSGQAPTSP